LPNYFEMFFFLSFNVTLTAALYTYEVARAVDEEDRVTDVVPVARRVLEHEDGVVGKVVLVDVGDGKHNIALVAITARRCTALRMQQQQQQQQQLLQQRRRQTSPRD